MLDQLPKDILVKIALDFDLPNIINFCLSSKEINRKVCENKFFWINKLIKDFQYTNLINPKIYYLEIDNIVKNNKYLLEYGFLNNRYDIIKIGIYKDECLQFFTFNHFEKLITVDENLINFLFNTKEKIIKNISQILTLIENLKIYNNKVQVLLYLYNFILPKITILVTERNFWVQVLIKLKQIYKSYPENFEKTYNEKLDFYKKLCENE